MRTAHILSVMVYAGMLLALFYGSELASSSGDPIYYRRIQGQCVAFFMFAGLASSIIALTLALWGLWVASPFGTFGIIHGLCQPVLLWPTTPQFPGVSLIVPAISIVIGLRAVMMTRRRNRE